jgi:hypothetical protein
LRLAFFVLDVATEVDEYTTTRLARAAAQGGHEVWYVGVGDVEPIAQPLHDLSALRASLRRCFFRFRRSRKTCFRRDV